MRRVLSPIALLVVVACGGSAPTVVTPPPAPPPPPPSTAPVSTIYITGADNPVNFIGEAVALAAVVRDSDGNVLTGRTVVWSVTGNATVTQNGTVTASDVGTEIVTATSEGKSGQITVLSGDGALLDTNGGTIVYPGHATLAIGPSSLRSAQRVAVVPASPPVGAINAGGLTIIPGTFVQFYPAGNLFAAEFENGVLTLTYDPASIPAGVDPARLVIVRYASNMLTGMQPTARGTNSLTTNQVSALVGFAVAY